ncbi:MAG: secretin and TonB N-terminal domain-containing protein [Candidatus Brocadiia bacterium]
MACLLLASLGAGAEPGESPVARSDAASAGPVNMEFRDTELPTVLRALCQGAGLDFVLDPGVEGKVTAKLRNTSWQNALETILRSHGLEARREGDTLLIAPRRPDAAQAAQATERFSVSPREDGTLDVDASAADIRDALRELAAAAEMNVVASKDVAGTVTASLRGLGPEEVLLALADSCGATVVDDQKVLRVIPRPVEPAAQGGPTPQAEVPSAQPAVEVRRLDDGRLDVRARQAPLRELLAQLAECSGLNVVAAPEVQGSVTLDLRGVGREDVLSAIAAHSGLTFRPVGNVLLAAPAPPEVQAEAFRLRYSEAVAVSKAIQESIEGAKVGVEPSNNLVIVTGTPQMLAAARQIIERIEVAPTLVSIEVRMVETNLTGEEKLGIDWSDAVGVTATTPEIPHTWPVKHGELVDDGGYRATFDPSDSRTRGAFAVPHASPDDFKFGILSSTGLSLVLRMLRTRTETHMLANPIVTVVENQEATINDVTRYPIASYEISEETGRVVISGFDYQEFGTILRVTPRVSDGHIALRVRPEVSRQAGTTVFENAELPIIRSQYTETDVRIRDGDTLVIAGLIREDTQRQRREVPFLSKVPLLGTLLFRSRHDGVNARRNLLIFITPHIVRDSDFAEAAELQKQHTEPLPAPRKGEEPVLE